MPTTIQARTDLPLLLVAMAWGSTYLVAKELVTEDSVLALLGVRMTIAAALLLVVVRMRRGRVQAAEWRVGAILGLLLSAIFALETFGIAHTSATNAGLIISLTLVCTPLLEAVLARRRPQPWFLVACATAVAGVALLAGGGTLRPPGLGDLLMLAAAVVRAVHVVSMHRLSAGRAMDSIRLTMVQLATCAVVFLVASTVVGQPIPAYVSALDGGGWVLLAYLVVGCTVFAFLVQTWAVRRTSPSRVSLLLGTEPVWAAVVGLTLAGDAITAPRCVGIALILVGTVWGRRIDERRRLPTKVHEGALTSADAPRGGTRRPPGQMREP